MKTFVERLKFAWNMENFGEDSVCRLRNGLVGADENAYCSYGEKRDAE